MNAAAIRKMSNSGPTAFSGLLGGEADHQKVNNSLKGQTVQFTDLDGALPNDRKETNRLIFLFCYFANLLN
jgi:hypothetical protein